MAENNSKESTGKVDRNKYPEMGYFMNEEKSDVVFIVEGQRVPAYKCMLSVKSPVFEAMFSGKFKESNDKEVVIKDTTFDAFKTLVLFIYTEQLVLTDGKDLDSIKEIVTLSDRYQMYRLIDIIGRYLKSMITFKNLKFICDIAFDYDIKELIKAVKEFIEINFNAIKNEGMAAVNRINEYTHNYFTEVLLKNYNKTEKFFDPIVKSKHLYYFRTGPDDTNHLNKKYSGQCTYNGSTQPIVPYLKTFNFNKIHEN